MSSELKIWSKLLWLVKIGAMELTQESPFGEIKILPLVEEAEAMFRLTFYGNN